MIERTPPEYEPPAPEEKIRFKGSTLDLTSQAFAFFSWHESMVKEYPQIGVHPPKFIITHPSSKTVWASDLTDTQQHRGTALNHFKSWLKSQFKKAKREERDERR